MSLCTPAGECVEVSPESDPELFDATLGGMGLTGVIVAATLRVEPLPAYVADDSDRTDGLEQTLALMTADDPHRYSVAWLDLLAPGSKCGRAIVSRSDPVPARGGDEHGPGQGGRRAKRSAMHLARPLFDVPPRFPGAVLHPSAVRAFNAVRWRSAPRCRRGHQLALAPYFFPLDVLGEWNRLYGRGGLIQYQFVVPVGQEAALMDCFELIRRKRLPVYLAVFKRLGAASGGPLSFPLEGWTLAADLPADAPGLAPALDELDELVAACGGRVYLSKDVRMRREVLRTMYPQLDRFETQRARVDPEGVLRSDLGLRLGLCGGAR
jgi:decaprenylphospho-beta-D-ribofuranose 2-oxidase